METIIIIVAIIIVIGWLKNKGGSSSSDSSNRASSSSSDNYMDKQQEQVAYYCIKEHLNDAIIDAKCYCTIADTGYAEGHYIYLYFLDDRNDECPRKDEMREIAVCMNRYINDALHEKGLNGISDCVYHTENKAGIGYDFRIS